MRAPVHDALAAIDEPVIVPVDERLADGLGVVVVHGEMRVGEIRRAAHALDLLEDVSAVLMRPVPACVDEFLASDIAAINAFCRKLFVDLRLRGDAGMIGAENPTGGTAAHAIETLNGVLDGIVERVPHMKHARDVRRRDGNGAIPHARTATVVIARNPFVEHALLDGF